jgi:hypothetical protein
MNLMKKIFIDGQCLKKMSFCAIQIVSVYAFFRPNLN